jgi:hypothetical protein
MVSLLKISPSAGWLSEGPKRGVMLPTGGGIPNYFAESAIIFSKGAHFMSSSDSEAIVVDHEANAWM